ncbi:hypothetical protein [Roseimicrobium sp. ORNL1]|uniref:hypothetical protein n=1 Tax=Roseimicrobium sp. ORNL1 TaxID=2711231 RepID=UPI0013E1EA43|nr:hypothetical protein [Roseimicrobium sp. ORNL1]QIF05250.1 hypothetical protein G5S37_28315 [Roseimicrobium sp. ORNL1]
MSETQPPPLAPQTPPLRRWKWRCFVLTVLYAGALMFFGYISFSFTLRYEKVFEEMLGDRTKLPTYTLMAINGSRLMQNNVVWLALLLVLLVPILLWVFRGNRVMSGIVLALIALMVAWSMAAIPALTLPVLEIVESINRNA